MNYPDAETLIQKYKLTTHIIHRQTDGITNQESVIQPPVRGNCMNWILGHILNDRNLVLLLLKEESIFNKSEAERYKRESDPVTGLEDGIPFDQMLEKLDLSKKRIVSGLKNISTERLAEIEEVGTLKEEVGALIAFMHWHETYHTGQFELLRQLAGKNDKVI
ncbi:MAG: hypothetical protein CVU42_05370 [Chloroflexi bacterium HGW-Chloroflexi-4]|jgi:hypothetical protein|nr:MAG: hypothetical protein CVU42_05370 [Chloroflexi bacterium HGW-Chloroflexi-4]